MFILFVVFLLLVDYCLHLSFIVFNTTSRYITSWQVADWYKSACYELIHYELPESLDQEKVLKFLSLSASRSSYVTPTECTAAF